MKWQADGKLWQAGLGILAWLLAVGIKEYAILPLSLALFLWWIFGLLAKKGKAWNLFLLGLVWAFALFIWMLALHKGLSGYLDYLQMRQSYGSEFLAFEWANSLKFLALKPLFWLGTAAILLKLKIKRRKEELLMLALQLGWLVFFLLSAGYDRFGFLLLFIPAIYLAEFAPYLWKEAGRMPKWKILKHTGLILLGLVIFSQQTFPKFAQRMLQPETINAAEKEMASQLKLLPKGKVMLFDQQLVPFLDTSVDWELVAFVPSFAIDLDNLDFSMPQMPNAYDMLVAGPYAFTEYDKWIEWGAIKPIYNGKMAEKWIIFGRKTARP